MHVGECDHAAAACWLTAAASHPAVDCARCAATAARLLDEPTVESRSRLARWRPWHATR